MNCNDVHPTFWNFLTLIDQTLGTKSSTELKKKTNKQTEKKTNKQTNTPNKQTNQNKNKTNKQKTSSKAKILQFLKMLISYFRQQTKILEFKKVYHPLNWTWILNQFILFGNCTSYQILACFVLYLKIINTLFLKNNISTVLGNQKWHRNFSTPSSFKILDQYSQNIVDQ